MRDITDCELDQVSGGKNFFADLSSALTKASNAVASADSSLLKTAATAQTDLAAHPQAAKAAATLFGDASTVLTSVEKGLSSLATLAANTSVSVTTGSNSASVTVTV
ncbi:hypothetical protein [Acetobacter estunensis]|uniref:hypothetical protein n=1 Tax=Acetobacter estunensis TaxID=104097 RepID=UPI001C2DA04C|nr:hypothetical protein [Acetobacter estunensis]MBV1837907.1 hypothetical protein [Acetobacter estunensis]